MGKATRKFFREFKDHTRLKLCVLREYLSRWPRILLQRGVHRRVWFVDGFAGRGQDDRGNEGSPLIACRIAAEVEREFGSGNREVRVIAFEANKGNASALRRALEEFGPAQGRTIPVHDGELADHLDEIRRLTGDEPTLCFLDPFGVKGLRADLVSKLLSGPKNELLILFSDESADRLRGAAVAPKPKSKRDLHRGQRGLFDDDGSDAASANDADTDSAGDDAASDDPTVRAWESTAGVSEEILDVAFGGNFWKPIVEATPRALARRKLLELYVEVLRHNGANT
jgi:three-Cys-motif partner protein